MNHSRKRSAAALSVASNTVLVIVKVLVGSLSGSVSILSEAIHSANDLVAALIAFASIRIAERPPDAEHRYGHGKAESISGAIEAGLILLAALWIIVEAVRKIIEGGKVEHLGLGAGIMALSGIVNTLVSRHLFTVAREEDSIALEADAHHLSTDVYTSLGVAGGLVIVWITGWHILDPIVAILVALLIFRIGWQLTRDAGHHLMDYSLPADELKQIETVLRGDSRVLSWHRLRTRKSGSEREIDVHIVLRGDVPLTEAHQVAVETEESIRRLFARAHVIVHADPESALPSDRVNRPAEIG
jgi:cation diffusion facilitator family transporter